MVTYATAAGLEMPDWIDLSLGLLPAIAISLLGTYVVHEVGECKFRRKDVARYWIVALVFIGGIVELSITYLLQLVVNNGEDLNEVLNVTKEGKIPKCHFRSFEIFKNHKDFYWKKG